MELIWYTAMSMDGRIAGPDDDMSFLTTIESGDDEDADAEFAEFVASIDGVLIGGSTMRWLVANGHGWPHGDLPTWLVSRDEHLAAAVGPTEQPLRQLAGEIGDAIDAMVGSGCTRAWLCGGGSIAGQALAADRVDEVIVTVAPVALGGGPSLFDSSQPLQQHRFQLVEARPYGTSGAARLRWKRHVKPALNVVLPVPRTNPATM